MDYGREYDFSRPFFEQFRGLMYQVPWPSRGIIDLVDSDYSDKASYLKNCYLCFNIGRAENSAYATSSWDVKDSFDLTQADGVELGYQCQEVSESYKTFFSLYCDEANEVWFSRDCTGCTNCLGCVNLRSKQYYIFNKPYARDEYFARLKEFDLGSYRGLARTRDLVRKAWLAYPYKYFHGTQNVNVSGDCIHNGKNTKFSYQVSDIEDSKYCQNANLGIKDAYDYTTWGENSELMYETMETGNNSRNMRFVYSCWPATADTEYSIYCGSSSNLFGCIGLKKKSHCIFNKQYSQEEYLVLRERIIQHMNSMPYTDQQGRVYRYGEFFPPEFSPHGYNETIAQDYFPLSKEAALASGFKWGETEIREFTITVRAEDLPDHINRADDSITREIISCQSCEKQYRIISSEFQFLKSNGIALPRECWECRHRERLSWINPPRYYDRNCSCGGEGDRKGVYQNQAEHFHGPAPCPNEFITTFAPDRPEIVYCESCYQSEVL